MCKLAPCHWKSQGGSVEFLLYHTINLSRCMREERKTPSLYLHLNEGLYHPLAHALPPENLRALRQVSCLIHYVQATHRLFLNSETEEVAVLLASTAWQ